MLTLITGAPGAGKTLWTIREVEKLREESGRKVFYNAIPGVTLPWNEINDDQARDAHALEPGSIIVVDEVYRLWPQGKPGEKLPPSIELFATHRHRGHDFFLLLQDRQRLHHFIRGLVGRHVHLERQYGLPRARVFEWQRLGDPRDPFEKQKATGSEFIYPKQLYGLYKSADLHTVKKRLPWFRLALIPTLIAVAASGIAYMLHRFHTGPGAQSTAASQTTAAVTAAPVSSGLVWAQRWQERVKGMPYSAPLYDEAFHVAAVPKISGCMEIETDTMYRCVCNTQQGTIITSMTVKDCRFYLKNGWFDPMKADGGELGSSEATAQINTPNPIEALAPAMTAKAPGKSSE